VGSSGIGARRNPRLGIRHQEAIMWGFTSQTIDGTAGSASGATGGAAVGTEANASEELAALGLPPPARADRAGQLLARDVLPGEAPQGTAGLLDAGHSPVM
jgi:hypothetical protein